MSCHELIVNRCYFLCIDKISILRVFLAEFAHIDESVVAFNRINSGVGGFFSATGFKILCDFRIKLAETVIIDYRRLTPVNLNCLIKTVDTSGLRDDRRCLLLFVFCKNVIEFIIQYAGKLFPRLFSFSPCFVNLSVVFELFVLGFDFDFVVARKTFEKCSLVVEELIQLLLTHFLRRSVRKFDRETTVFKAGDTFITDSVVDFFVFLVILTDIPQDFVEIIANRERI